MKNKQNASKNFVKNFRKLHPNETRGADTQENKKTINLFKHKDFLLIVLIATILALIILTNRGFISAHSETRGFDSCGTTNWFYNGIMGGFGAGIFSWLFMSLITIILVLFIVLIIKQIQKN